MALGQARWSCALFGSTEFLCAVEKDPSFWISAQPFSRLWFCRLHLECSILLYLLTSPSSLALLGGWGWGSRTQTPFLASLDSEHSRKVGVWFCMNSIRSSANKWQSSSFSEPLDSSPWCHKDQMSSCSFSLLVQHWLLGVHGEHQRWAEQWDPAWTHLL